MIWRDVFGRGKSKSPTPQRNSTDPLDKPLLWFSDSDAFTMRDSFESVQIFGAVGSGKTSGSGAAFALSYLRAGYGGLVLTCKPDEAVLWQSYCRKTGRDNDLVIFSPDTDTRFNFLDYAASRPGRGSGLTQNIVALLKTAMEAGQNEKQQHSSEAYWENALNALIAHSIDALLMAGETLSISNLYKLVLSAASDPDEMNSEK